MQSNTNLIERKKRFGHRERREILFIAIITALPLAQFAIFYVYVNINSVIMAFQKYDSSAGRYIWFGMNNFRRLWSEFYKERLLLTALKNSALYYVIHTAIGVSLALLFSYYIFKKRAMHSLYKIMLFLPSILSSIVVVLLFKYFVDYAIPNIWSNLFGKTIEGLASSIKTQFGTVLFYCVWAGFGTGILMYVGAMNNISESLVEAAELDGATLLQEFWHVTLPCSFPTISTFLVAGIATFFTADMNLFSFYGAHADPQLWTVGYYILRKTRTATISDYPYIASVGLVCTIITLPFAFGLRKLLSKVGPSAE